MSTEDREYADICVEISCIITMIILTFLVECPRGSRQHHTDLQTLETGLN